VGRLCRPTNALKSGMVLYLFAYPLKGKINEFYLLFQVELWVSLGTLLLF
jgi:hypothetical protein